MSAWVGGSTATTPRWTAFGSSSSRPPGSGTSVTFGLGLTTATPGSAESGLIVSDVEAAYDEFVGRGIDVSDIWHGPPFPVEARQPGPDPERTSYGSFFYFNDPDSNTWLVQEVTTRLPGRMNPTETGYVPGRLRQRSRAAPQRRAVGMSTTTATRKGAR